jgi:DNA-directed RNA polymerase subunit E'/Rpb7
MATFVKSTMPIDGRTASCERDVPQAGKLYLYINSIMTTKLSIHITQIGQITQKNLEEALIERISNKCVNEGYIRPKSIRIQTYSSGAVRGENIDFHVVYQCQVSHPVEGQVLEATVKTITKAGIHAQCVDSDGNVPVTIFIAKDHHVNSQEINNVKAGDTIYACVIGARFELNDPYICVIAKLIPAKYSNKFQNKRIRVVGGDVDMEDIVEADTEVQNTEIQQDPKSDDLSQKTDVL